MVNELRYRLKGSGGPQVFWFVDKFGGTPWAEIDNLGFNLLPGNPNPNELLSAFTGSFFLSEPFHISDSESIAVSATVAIAGFKDNNYMDVGFGLLLQGGTVKDILFALRPDGILQITDNAGPIGLFNLAAPTDPSGFQPSPASLSNLFVGGVDYSRGLGTYVASSLKPGAGDYQLLFGMFTGLPGPTDQPSTTIVWSVATR
jgi:hypothetical protein